MSSLRRLLHSLTSSSPLRPLLFLPSPLRPLLFLPSPLRLSSSPKSPRPPPKKTLDKESDLAVKSTVSVLESAMESALSAVNLAKSDKFSESADKFSESSDKFAEFAQLKPAKLAKPAKKCAAVMTEAAAAVKMLPETAADAAAKLAEADEALAKFKKTTVAVTEAVAKVNTVHKASDEATKMWMEATEAVTKIWPGALGSSLLVKLAVFSVDDEGEEVLKAANMWMDVDANRRWGEGGF